MRPPIWYRLLKRYWLWRHAKHLREAMEAGKAEYLRTIKEQQKTKQDQTKETQ